MKRNVPALAASLIVASALLAGCGGSDDIGPSQEAPGPMGSTDTESTADLPAKNSQSTPISVSRNNHAAPVAKSVPFPANKRQNVAGIPKLFEGGQGRSPTETRPMRA